MNHPFDYVASLNRLRREQAQAAPLVERMQAVLVYEKFLKMVGELSGREGNV